MGAWCNIKSRQPSIADVLTLTLYMQVREAEVRGGAERELVLQVLKESELKGTGCGRHREVSNNNRASEASEASASDCTSQPRAVSNTNF